MKSTYLVTGGAGFIGSHLVDALLKAGHSVIVLDDLSSGKRENVATTATLVVGSVCDESLVHSLFNNNDIKGCFHLAAIPSVKKGNEDWLATHCVNLGGAITVFDAARQADNIHPVPIVYASSAAVYGDNTALPLRETAHISPLSAYGADKYACELHARVAGYVHRVPTIGLRFFNVYGPRQDPASPYSGVISIFMQHMQENCPLTVYGDGQQSRDFIFVADVVRFCMAAMKQAHIDAPVLNICRAQPVTLLELIEVMSDLFQYQPDLIFEPERQGDIKHSLGSPDKAKQMLSLEAMFSLEDGLKQLYMMSVYTQNNSFCG